MYFPANPINVENIVNSEVDVEDLIQKFILTKTIGGFDHFINQQCINDGQVFLPISHPTTFITSVNHSIVPPNQFLESPLVSMQSHFNGATLNVLPPNNHIVNAYPQFVSVATPINTTPQAPSPDSQFLTPVQTNEMFQLAIHSDQFQTQYFTQPGQFSTNFQPEISWIALPESSIAQVDQPSYYYYLPPIENCNILLTSNQNEAFSNVSEDATNQQVLAQQIMPTSSNTPECVSFVQQIAIQNDIPDAPFVPNQMTKLNCNNEVVMMEGCMARKQGTVKPCKEKASTLSKCLTSKSRETATQPMKLKTMATKQAHTNPYGTIHPLHKNDTNLKTEEKSKRTEARVNQQKHTHSCATIQPIPKVNTHLTSEEQLVQLKELKSEFDQQKRLNTYVPQVQENIMNLKREKTLVQPMALNYEVDQQKLTNPCVTTQPVHKINTSLKTEAKLVQPVTLKSKVNQQEYKNSYVIVQPLHKNNSSLKTRVKLEQTMEFKSEDNLQKHKTSFAKIQPKRENSMHLKTKLKLEQPITFKSEVKQQKHINPSVIVKIPHENNINLKSEEAIVQPKLLKCKIQQQEHTKSSVIVQPKQENKTNPKIEVKLERPLASKNEMNQQKHSNSGVIVQPLYDKTSMMGDVILKQPLPLKSEVNQQRRTNPSVIVQMVHENNTRQTIEERSLHPTSRICEIREQKHTNPSVIVHPLHKNSSSLKVEERLVYPKELLSEVNHQKHTNSNVMIQHMRLPSEVKQQNYTNSNEVVQPLHENSLNQKAEEKFVYPMALISKVNNQKYRDTNAIVQLLHENSINLKAEESLVYPTALTSEVNQQKHTDSNLIVQPLHKNRPILEAQERRFCPFVLTSEVNQPKHTDSNLIVKPLHENSSNSKAEENFVYPMALISEVNHQKYRDTNAIVQPIPENSINPKAEESFHESNTNQNTEGRLLHSMPLRLSVVEQTFTNPFKSIPPQIINKAFENIMEPAESIATTSKTSHQTAPTHQHSAIKPLDKSYSLSSCYLEAIERYKRAQEMIFKSQINQRQNSTFLARKHMLPRNRPNKGELERQLNSYTNYTIELSQSHEEVEADIRNKRIQKAYEVISRLIKAVEKRPLLYQNDPKEYYVDLNTIRTWIEVAQETLGTRDGTQICACINTWRAIYDDYQLSLQMGVLHELDGMLHFLKSSNVGNVDNCEKFHVAEKCDNVQKEYDSNRENDLCLKESDQRFLVSLLPDLRHMNEKQMEFFEKSVVELISEISV